MTPERLETMLRDALNEMWAFSGETEGNMPSISLNSDDPGVTLTWPDGSTYVVTITKSR